MQKLKAHERYVKFLRSENKSITPERLKILDEILKQKGHFRIDEIIDHLVNSKNKVSRATVYRSIRTIEDAGLIKHIRSINDEKIYELIEGHHDHIICEKCGKIIEFHNSEMEALQSEICKSYGFDMHDHILKIFGVCKNCKK